jgi:hypothetical protein
MIRPHIFAKHLMLVLGFLVCTAAFIRLVGWSVDPVNMMKVMFGVAGMSLLISLSYYGGKHRLKMLMWRLDAMVCATIGGVIAVYLVIG